MRRYEREKKDRINKIIIGVVLIGVMLFSVVGYAFRNTDEDEEKIEYNDVGFVSRDGRWVFELEKEVFNTRFNPEETENISVPDVFLENYAGKNLYFSVESIWENEIKQEVWVNMHYFVEGLQDACLDENCTDDELPIKDCYEDNIIIVEEGESNEIKKKGNCIFIKAPEEEQIRIIDAVLFRLLDIAK